LPPKRELRDPQFGDLITADSMKTVHRRFENGHVILLLKFELAMYE